MQHCFADNMVDRKLYVIVIVIALMLQQTVVNMRNRTLYLTVLQFDLCGVQGDKLDHYRKGADSSKHEK